MTLQLKLNDIIHYNGNSPYTGKIVKVDKATVKIYWDDNTSTTEDIDKDDDYTYIGNMFDSDFDKKVFAFQLKGVIISDINYLINLTEVL